MKEEEKEDKLYRNTISFGTSANNKLKNEKMDNRARSASLSNNKLLSKYIPRLKPVGTTINPSPINLILKKKNLLNIYQIIILFIIKTKYILIGKEELVIDDENFKIEPKRKLSKKSLFLKIKSFEINEEINDYAINATDEENNYNKYNKNKLTQGVSDSSDNESIKDKDKENKLDKNNDSNKNSNLDNNNENINKIEKLKKNVNNCINKIRRKLDKIKNNIKKKKFKDDSNALNFSYTKYFSENNKKIKYGENYIRQIKMERIDYNEIKNKTISFKDIKSFKPPILNFLQMNEVSNNSTLSSCNLSEV